MKWDFGANSVQQHETLDYKFSSCLKFVGTENIIFFAMDRVDRGWTAVVGGHCS